MTWSTLSCLSVTTDMYADGTRCSRRAALVMIPVRPIPPTVAQKSSGSSDGVTQLATPRPSISSTPSTWSPKLPARWWFFPCTSQAIAPPTVACRVPGVTTGNNPAGTSAEMSPSRDTPASTGGNQPVGIDVELAGGQAHDGSTGVLCRVTVGATETRAKMPRPDADRTASATSPAPASTTDARVRAVRPQPLSRLGPACSGSGLPGTATPTTSRR